MSRVLCLTGMHRSGTSLTASWLQSCGLVIDVGGLVGPAAGNPRGHFEDVEMMTLQRAEFVAHRRRSRGWQLDRPEFWTFAPDRRAEAGAMLASRNARFDQWGWKDPRSLPFLRQWHELEPELRTVILWRPMADVVDSLLRRAQGASNRDFKVSPTRAVSTWIAYNELGRRYKVEHPDTTMVVPLSRVLRHGSAVLDQLVHQLGVSVEDAPVAALFEPGLLKDAGQSDLLKSWRVGHRVAEAWELEAELTALSQV